MKKTSKANNKKATLTDEIVELIASHVSLSKLIISLSSLADEAAMSGDVKYSDQLIEDLIQCENMDRDILTMMRSSMLSEIINRELQFFHEILDLVDKRIDLTDEDALQYTLDPIEVMLTMLSAQMEELDREATATEAELTLAERIEIKKQERDARLLAKKEEAGSEPVDITESNDNVKNTDADINEEDPKNT